MNTIINSLIEDISCLFFKVNFQITDLSKDSLPRVKVFIPDSMPQATVQYDDELNLKVLKMFNDTLL